MFTVLGVVFFLIFGLPHFTLGKRQAKPPMPVFRMFDELQLTEQDQFGAFNGDTSRIHVKDLHNLLDGWTMFGINFLI